MDQEIETPEGSHAPVTTLHYPNIDGRRLVCGGWLREIDPVGGTHRRVQAKSLVLRRLGSATSSCVKRLTGQLKKQVRLNVNRICSAAKDG